MLVFMSPDNFSDVRRLSCHRPTSTFTSLTSYPTSAFRVGVHFRFASVTTSLMSGFTVLATTSPTLALTLSPTLFDLMLVLMSSYSCIIKSTRATFTGEVLPSCNMKIMCAPPLRSIQVDINECS